MEKRAIYKINKTKPTETHGGKRKGAGRPPGKNKKNYAIALTESESNVLKIIGHGNRSLGVAALIEQYTNPSP